MVTAREIPPGGVGEVKATFNSRGYQGSVRKTFTVETNDPENQEIRLVLRGTVVPEIFVTPRHVNFGKVSRKAPAKPVQLVIRVREGDRLQITKVHSESPFITLTVKEAGQDKMVYSVSLVDKLPTGRLTGSITVHTNSKSFPRVQVPFQVLVEGKVQ